MVKPERLAERIDGAIAALDLRAMKRLAWDTLALAPETPAVVRAGSQLAALLAELR